MPSVRLWKLDLGGCFDVVPPVDTGAGGRCPDVLASSDDLVDALVLLADSYRETLVHLGTVAHVALGYYARAVRRVEDGEDWRVRGERPHAVVVHGEGVHAATGCHGPHFNGLVRGARQDGVAVLGKENVAHIVCVADKLGDALARAGVPHAHDALGPSARDDVGGDGQGVDGALGRVLVLAHGDFELLAGAIEVPQADLAVEAARGNPVLIAARRCDALDVVGVQADGLRRERVGGRGAPDLDGDVGRGRDKGGAVLGEDDIVDPVGVGLDLLAELGGRGLEVGGIGVGEGVVLVGVVRGQVEVQVPCADDAVATARVEDRVGSVDGQAIDSQPVASCRIGQRQHCTRSVLCRSAAQQARVP